MYMKSHLHVHVQKLSESHNVPRKGSGAIHPIFYEYSRLDALLHIDTSLTSLHLKIGRRIKTFGMKDTQQCAVLILVLVFEKM